MIDSLQCQTHTRTPWGSSPHRYDPRLRYLVMGLLCASVLAVFTVSLVFVGNSAIRNYASDDAGAGDGDTGDPRTSTGTSSLTTGLPSSAVTISATKVNRTSHGITATASLQTLLQTTITVPFDDSYTADVG